MYACVLHIICSDVEEGIATVAAEKNWKAESGESPPGIKPLRRAPEGDEFGDQLEGALLSLARGGVKFEVSGADIRDELGDQLEGEIEKPENMDRESVGRQIVNEPVDGFAQVLSAPSLNLISQDSRSATVKAGSAERTCTW